MESSVKSIDEVVEEIMRIHRSMPRRPDVDEVEAAKTLIQQVDKEDQWRLEAIARHKRSADVPEVLFMVFQEMLRGLVYFHSKKRKTEALQLLDLEMVHSVFDDLIQRASSCLSSTLGSNSRQSSYSSASVSSTVSSSFSWTNSASFSGGWLNSPVTNTITTSASSLYDDEDHVKASALFTRDDSYLKKAKATSCVDGLGAGFRSCNMLTTQILDSTLKQPVTSDQDGRKMSLIKLASLIEMSTRKATRDLNLQNQLMDQIEWLPDSIGKVSSLITLDLSDNQIAFLPATMGRLSSLTKLDMHSNRISELPESIGDLCSLVFLDLRGNSLTSVPSSFCRLVHLEELDLSSNHLSVLPESIGSLVGLKKLSVEINRIEGFPHTIGELSSLRELHADYNCLKALPEAVGQIESLEILSVRYNNIKQLPATMSSLSRLKELDVSFNELESVPEGLCFATKLVKMNISNNFAVLRSLPRSIGNLEMLEEFDISNNQIQILPDSFRMLSRLRVLSLEGNPMEIPPRNIVEMGVQAVIQYMADLGAKRDYKARHVRHRNSWAYICFFSRSNKRKHKSIDYVKA